MMKHTAEEEKKRLEELRKLSKRRVRTEDPAKYEERKARQRERNLNPKGPQKRLYTLQESAYYLGRTVHSVREIIWAGKIPFVKVDRRLFIDIKDLERLVEQFKERFTF
jgi:hypothetical protein